MSYVENLLRTWIPLVVLIATLALTFGYSKSEIDNNKSAIKTLQVIVVPRQELDQIILRFDKGLDRLEKAIDKLESK